jgi:DNA processing protein
MQAVGPFNRLRKLSQRDIATIDGFSDVLARKVFHIMRDVKLQSDMERTVLETRKLQRVLRADMITCQDPRFPPLLARIYDPPLYLFCRGTLPSHDDACISIVGTRFPSDYGEKVTAALVRDLCASGITIVSGLALGIDTIAHRTAIQCGGRTVAVLGSGLGRIYPSSNTNLARAIVENGCLTSEFHLNAKPDHVNFPRRNRIISGLSLGVVVVETASKGGALITAQFAIDQNRDVFAVPGSIFNPLSTGTHELIQSGQAHLVKCAEDIISELPGRVHSSRAVVAAQQLTIEEQMIMDLLDGEPVHIDEIAVRSGRQLSDLLVQLLQMEFRGVIRQLPGKYFARID